MKVALCLFFNYPFERNIPVLESLYRDTFDDIVHIQPMMRSDRDNVHTVYRAAFNFGGFFSDSLAFLSELDADYLVFSGDDCIINTALFGDNFATTFLRDNEEISAFLPQPLKFCNGNEWGSSHKINTLARFAKGYGLYDQRIEDWLGFLPDPNPIRNTAQRLAVHSDKMSQPTAEQKSKMNPAQLEVLTSMMGNQSEAPMPYPLVYAISDFFIVSRKNLELFCHNVGLLAAMNIFSEVSVPTALMSLPGPLLRASDLNLTFDWTWGRNQEVEHFVPTSIEEIGGVISDMDTHTLFRHPIKLSKVNCSS
jgi:hypothetical protein